MNSKWTTAVTIITTLNVFKQNEKIIKPRNKKRKRENYTNLFTTTTNIFQKKLFLLIE